MTSPESLSASRRGESVASRPCPTRSAAAFLAGTRELASRHRTRRDHPGRAPYPASCVDPGGSVRTRSSGACVPSDSDNTKAPEGTRTVEASPASSRCNGDRNSRSSWRYSETVIRPGSFRRRTSVAFRGTSRRNAPLPSRRRDCRWLACGPWSGPSANTESKSDQSAGKTNGPLSEQRDSTPFRRQTVTSLMGALRSSQTWTLTALSFGWA
jgi:hypothetical protein